MTTATATAVPVRGPRLPAGLLGFARDTMLLTGRSLRDSRVRLELELALTIREIVRAGTPG